MSGDLTLYYAADLHGSDLCFKKWLNAGRFYGADIVVIGGDLTGKVLVPIIPAGNGSACWSATWDGRAVRLESRAEVEAFTRTVRERGAYGFETTADEVEAIRGSADLERAVFARLKVAAIEEWVELADRRLADGGPRAIVMPGNDDPEEIDGILGTSRTMENANGRALELAPGIWMASRGESTPTPWNTPREVSEEVLGERVASVVEQIPAGATSIWNIHMPPHRTGVDEAPLLDDDLRVRYDGSGEPVMKAVGSESVRGLILERQPTLALHGHIHEGRGRYKLGRTVGFNPGSRYEDGALMGILLRISAGKGVRDHAFTLG
jgi:uncharacterized protein